jgi:hypothetical protein
VFLFRRLQKPGFDAVCPNLLTQKFSFFLMVVVYKNQSNSVYQGITTEF